ncbi:NUDIX domain-containing protein [Gordonia sp. HY002]|uniref:NUDIX hydrolase n=1 Tax=Gordonia zhenghanii TaxID=2911516 RepID=UPI001EF0E355|nr:NUDIX domain-containing protein [Gordonia zhenghanii]MCF8569589.1 NUDIX domain-containing protein [Gordonia zhenghanii]MCF8602890.1 NUDIX domain-containing protein [Gordonia zhenghanii]
MTRVLAASAVIVDDVGRVLLVQRGHEPEKGHWSVPGGHVEDGETFAEAARREVLEETGLHVEIGDELWAVDVPYDEYGVFEIHDFAATVVGGTLQAGDDADDVRWASDTDLDSLPLTKGLATYLRRSGAMS